MMRFVLIWVAAALLCLLCACRRNAESGSRPLSLDDLQRKVVAGNLVSESEVNLLSKEILNGSPADSSRGALLLGMLQENGTIDRSQYRATLMNAVVRAKSEKARILLKAVRVTVKLPVPKRTIPDELLASGSSFSENRLTAADATFLDSVLASPSVSERVLIGDLLIQKHALEGEDRTKSQAFIETAIMLSESATSWYWQFVKEAVQKRSE